MTPTLPPIVNGVWRLNNSSLSNILACPRKGWFQHCHRRVSAFEDPSQRFGSALHKAMEIRYRQDGSAPCSPATRALQDAAIDTFFPPDDLQGGVGGDEEWQNAGRAKEVVAYWNHEFRREPFEVLETERGVEVAVGELSLSWCPKCGVSVYPCCVWTHESRPLKLALTGRIDALVRYSGRVMVHDYKSTKWQQPRTEKWAMSPQFRQYCLLASSLGYGPVRDYWIDSLVVLKPLKKKTPSSRPDNSFSRDQFHVTDEEVEEFRRETLAHAETFLRYCLAGPPPRNLNSCHVFRACSYLDVCKCASPDAGLAWLNGGNYRLDEHDPLKP